MSPKPIVTGCMKGNRTQGTPRQRATRSSLLGGVLSLLAAFFIPAAEGQAQVPSTGQSGPSAAVTLPLPRRCQTPLNPSRQVSELLQALSHHPTASGYSALGALYAQKRTLDCAIPAFQAALQLDAKSWEARYNLALALIQSNDGRHAESELRTVIQQKPDFAPARNALGLVLERRGEREDAAEQFKEAVRLDPSFAFAFYNLAQVLMAQKRYDAAVYYLRQGLRAPVSKELDYQLRLALAVACAQGGNYGDAIQTLREMASMYPNSAEVHFNLASAYAHHLQYREAAAEYQETLLSPGGAGNVTALVSLAKALMELDDFSPALPYLQTYSRQRPEDPEAHFLLGEARRGLGQYTEAEKEFRLAVKMDPDDYKSHYKLGYVLARLGKNNEAVEQLDEAKKLKPDAPETLYELGLLLANRSRRMRRTGRSRLSSRRRREVKRRLAPGISGTRPTSSSGRATLKAPPTFTVKLWRLTPTMRNCTTTCRSPFPILGTCRVRRGSSSRPCGWTRILPRLTISSDFVRWRRRGPGGGEGIPDELSPLTPSLRRPRTTSRCCMAGRQECSGGGTVSPRDAARPSIRPGLCQPRPGLGGPGKIRRSGRAVPQGAHRFARRRQRLYGTGDGGGQTWAPPAGRRDISKGRPSATQLFLGAPESGHRARRPLRPGGRARAILRSDSSGS